MDLNKVQLIGRASQDPEMRQTGSGQNVCSFSVATGRSWKDANSGEQKEQTEFHNIVAWGKLAEIVNNFVKKGKQIYIEGRLQTRSWDDQNTGAKKYKTEIVAENIILLGGTSANSGNQSSGSENSSYKNNDSAPVMSDDLPPARAVSSDEITIEDVPF